MKRSLIGLALSTALCLCIACAPAAAFALDAEPVSGEVTLQASSKSDAVVEELSDGSDRLASALGVEQQDELAEQEAGERTATVPETEEASSAECNADALREAGGFQSAAIQSGAVQADSEQPVEITASAQLNNETPLMAQMLGTQATTVVDGVYTLVASTGESKCLDVPGGSAGNGVGLQIYSQNATPAQRWSIHSLGGGLYEIINVGSGMALDVAGAVKASGTVVQQYLRNSTDAQKWKIVEVDSGSFKLISALSDSLVLDVSGGSSSNGAKVQLWTDNGTKAQRWMLVAANVVEPGFYVVRSEASGKVLDINGGSLVDSGNVQQYSKNGTQAQTFYFDYDSSDGYYTITNLGSGKVLDVAGGSSSNGANVQQYLPNGTRAQKWAAVKSSNDAITFMSSVSGLALDVSGASQANGANVQVYSPNGTNAQRWTLFAISNWLPEGSYTIITTVNINNVVDISDGSTNAGANVQAYSSNSTNAQRFYFRSVGGGYYTIQNPISGYYLNVSRKSLEGNVVTGAAEQQFMPVFSAGGISFQLKDDASLVLDIASASTKSGANVQLYKSNGTAAQRFLVHSTDLFADGAYSIRYAANSGYVIDVPGASTSSGEQLQLYEGNGTSAQRFRFVRVEANTYQITAACSGKALQVVSAGEGSYQLQQCDATSSNNQKWAILLASDGTIQLAPKSNSNLRIDLSSDTVQNSNPIVVYVSNGTSAQKWKLVPSAESTTYDVLGLTLRRMAELQKSGGNNSGLTVDQLMELLDPSKVDKTQFLDVRTATGITADQLNDFITSTSKGQSGMLNGLGSAFATAANTYGLNEVYLLAHAILESGWGTSELASGYYYSGGTIDGTYYPAGTYYNFYGIGAYDSSPLSGGRKLAIINGWNSPAKAVTGAAKWIASNYVYASSYAQPTLYAMKWDYARTVATGERGWHQYATSTSWPDSIAQLINQCYSRFGGNLNQVYVIPQYA